MLIAPTAVAALGNRNRLLVRNIGDYSARFGILYKGADRNGYNKIRRAFACATTRTAFLSRFGGIFTLVTEIGKGGQVAVRLKDYIAASAAVAAVRTARVYILFPVKGNRAITAVTRL